MTSKTRTNVETYYANFRTPKGELTTAISFGVFEELVPQFSLRGFKLISLEENAWLRISRGKYSPECWTGNFLREGFMYIPGRGAYLIRHSPINDNLKTSRMANSLGSEYHVTLKESERHLKNAVQIPYDLKEIKVSDFETNSITQFAFGSAVSEYANFLKDANVDKLPIWLLPEGLVDGQSQPFIRQAILRCMDNWSGLIGSHADLHLPYGVRFSSSKYKGKVDDHSEVYSVEEIMHALRVSSLSGLEIPILRALRQRSALPVNFANDPFMWGKKKK
jgi:hypothetical protein